MGITLSVFSTLLFITETVLQLYLTINVFPDNLTIYCVTATVIALPFLIANIVSAILVLKTMNFTGKNCGKMVCMFLHVCQLGLIWRFFKLLLLYEERDWYEFINLHLLHTSLQSLPFVVFTGFTIFCYMDLNINSITIVFAAVAVLSSAVTMTTFNIGKHLFESDEFLERKVKLKKHIGIILLIMGTALLLISRCGSIIMLSSIQTYWVLIPLGFHILAYFIATVAYNCAKNDNSCYLILQKIILAFINMFDLLDTSFKKIQCTYVLYYAAILVENIGMTAVWLMLDDSGHMLKLMTVVVILMGFLVGMILKFGSCGLIFPESADALADSSTCSENPSKHLNESESISKPREQYSESVNCQPDDAITKIPHHQNSDLYDLKNSSICNGNAIHNYQNAVFQMDDEIDYKKSNPTRKSQITVVDELSCRASIHIKDTETQVQSSFPHNITDIHLFQYSVESNDIASSNSRNTNTINQESKNRTDLQSSKYTKKFNNFNANYTFPRTRNPPQGSVTTTSDRFAQHNERFHEPSWLKQTNLKFKSSGKQSHFKCSHEPSLDYFPESYSETVSVIDYFSEDDYFDSTEWSTSDSNCATTWPPSNQHSSNLHSLPKGKISKHENIRLWLKNLPSHSAMCTGQELPYSDCSLPQKQKWFKHLKPKKVLSNLCGVGLEPMPRLFAAEMETQISESSLPFRKPAVRRWQPADTLVVCDGVLESVV